MSIVNPFAVFLLWKVSQKVENHFKGGGILLFPVVNETHSVNQIKKLSKLILPAN
jgi:hypothetical protein